MPGNSAACSSLVATQRIASAPSTELAKKGEGTSARPISSSTMPSSRYPKPWPPKDSERWTPCRPSSAAICFQSAGSKPAGAVSMRRTSAGGAFSSKKRRSTLRNSSCSSLNAKFIGSGLLAGDDPGREVLRAAAVRVAERLPCAVHLVRAGHAAHLERRLGEANQARGADRVRGQHAARHVDREVAVEGRRAL